MIKKPKLVPLFCLAALIIALLIRFGMHSDPAADAGPVAGKQGGSSPDPRSKADMDTRLTVAIAEYRKSERPKYSEAAPYHLSPAEMEKFLQERGRTASSLYFLLLCAGNRDLLLDQIAALPDSPLKLQILAIHTGGEERLSLARKYVEIDPGNKIAHLMLSHALLKQGFPDEASQALKDSSGASEIRSGRDDLAAEFKAGCEILGEDRGYQMLELHWRDYAVNVAHRTAGRYMASLDPATFIRDGEADVPLMLGKMDDFYRSVGFDEDGRREVAMMKVRDSVVGMKGTAGITNAAFEADRLNRELDAEFIGGFKRAAAFDKLSPAQRNQRLAETYLNGF